MKPFKRSDIKPCASCGKGIMHENSMGIFWRLKIERLIVDPIAVQRAHGLEQFFGGGRGGAVLAHVMGSDDDMAKPLTALADVLVCEPCVNKLMMGLHILAELAVDEPSETA